MKKILSVLLAICLMVGMVTVLASADEVAATKAYFKLPMASSAAAGATQTGYTMNAGDADKYFKTNSDGFVVADGASASDYNIKVTFKAGEPLTVYLKGAYISVPRNIGSASNGAIIFGLSQNNPADCIQDFATLIVVETDSQLKNTWSLYEENDSGKTQHGNPCINSISRGGLTITGPGKLDLWADNASLIASYSTLTLKDITLKAELNINHEWGAFNTIESDYIVFDNAKAELINNYNGVIKTTAEDGTVTVKNGSDVSAITYSSGAWAAPLVVAPGGITIDSSKLLAFASGEGMYSIGKQTVTMTGVKALGGTKQANAKEFSEKKQGAYTYFLAGPDVVIPTEAPTTATTASKATSATKATKATTATTASQATSGAAVGGNNAGGNNAATKPAGNAGNDATNAVTNPTDNNTTAEDKGNLTWLYILLGVVVLAGAGAFVLIIMKKNAAANVEGDEAEAEEETEATEEEISEDAE